MRKSLSSPIRSVVKPDVNPAEPEHFLVFGSPTISEDEIAEVESVLRSGWLGTGPYVHRFESAFAHFKGAQQAVAVSSCSAALHLSLLAAELEPGDEVITTPLTFCATVNAIIHAGGTPVLADVDPYSMNIDPRAAERAVTNRTRAIIPVHLAGWPCEMDPILSLADAHHLKVIEDCAHAIEGEYRSKPCGTMGDFGCFSFYVTKNITTVEGGMVLARNPDAAERVRRLSLHGLSAHAWERQSPAARKDYDVVEVGFKYNMTDIQAALGLKQFGKLDAYGRLRRAAWQEYDRKLSGLPITLPHTPPEHVKHAHHLYTVLVDPRRAGVSRDEFIDAMGRAGIGVGIHYRSVAEYGLYRRLFGWDPVDYPVALEIGRQTVSLPLSAKISEGDIDRVVRTVAGICR